MVKVFQFKLFFFFFFIFSQKLLKTFLFKFFKFNLYAHNIYGLLNLYFKLIFLTTKRIQPPQNMLQFLVLIICLLYATNICILNLILLSSIPFKKNKNILKYYSFMVFNLINLHKFVCRFTKNKKTHTIELSFPQKYANI